MRTDTTTAMTGWRGWLHADAVVALVAVVVLLPSSIALLADAAVTPDQTTLVFAALLYTVLHAASLIAIRQPVFGFALASAAMLALVATPGIREIFGALFPSVGAYLLVVAQVAIQCGLVMRLFALVGGVLGAALIAVTGPEMDQLVLRVGTFVGLSGAIVAAWGIGLLVRFRRAQAQERLRLQVSQAIADERARINRDLHDLVAHSLTVMIAQAEVARAVGPREAGTADRALGTVIRTGRDALRGMRAVVAEAAPREPLPTVDSLSSLIESVRTPGVEVDFDEAGARTGLRPDAAIALHHAVREALTNAVRHVLPPVRIRVRLRWDAAAVHAEVTDDGGAGPARSDLGAGTGLVGITERVRCAGGTLTAAAVHPRGWAVTVELPADEEGE